MAVRGVLGLVGSPPSQPDHETGSEGNATSPRFIFAGYQLRFGGR